MEPEDESLQMQLLRSSNESSGSTRIVYRILLDNLRAKDFRSFKSLLEQSLKKRNYTIDVNHVYVEQSEETLLDVACIDGSAEFVEFLLEKGAQANRVNKTHNRAPIHFAVEEGHVEVLQVLLKEPTINPNLEAGQQTALHIAVKKNHRKCVELLLDGGASPNIPNSKGITALHLAAMKSQTDMIEIIRQKSKHSLDLDGFKDYNGETARQILQRKLPNIELPPPRKRDLNVHNLRYYLNANDEVNFIRALENSKIELPNEAVEDLLETAARLNFRKAVGQLVSRLPDPGSHNLLAAAIAAVRHGNHEILRELLRINGDMGNDLIIDACEELGRPTLRGLDISRDRLECLKIILQEDNVNVRCVDGKGCTPLHYAARAGNKEAMNLLLEKGSYIGHFNKFNVPPLADIPADVIVNYLDNCLQIRHERTNEYTIEFDYKSLVPHEESQEFVAVNHRSLAENRRKREIEIFSYIARKNGLKHLLKHPLLSSFLYLKWHRIRHLLYVNFIFYVIFYFLLNVFILRGMNIDNDDGGNINSMEGKNGTEKVEEFATGQVLGLRTATSIALFFLILREILQFLSSPIHYVSSVENWLEITLIALTTALLTGVLSQQFGALAILLSAWELVVLIGQHPRMSTGIEMFKTVSVNFIRFLFLYAFLILAFALAFLTLFKEGGDENFPDLGHSLFKTIIMLTGEFDANDIPFVSNPILSRFVFTLFVFLIAIVLFNLLNGLAVSDTAEILGKAELVGLISRTRLVAYMENVALGPPTFLRVKSCRYYKFNPFGFLAGRVLLFPDYLKSTKILVAPYENFQAYSPIKCCGKCLSHENHKDRTYPVMKMEPHIIKQAKEILSRRGQVSEIEKINIELEKINEHLTIIGTSLEIVKQAMGNNNLNINTESEN